MAGLGHLSLAEGSVQPSTTRNLRELLPIFTDVAHPPSGCAPLLEAFQFFRSDAPADASPPLGIADDAPEEPFLPDQIAHRFPHDQCLPLDSAVNALEYGETDLGPSNGLGDVSEDDSCEGEWPRFEADDDALAMPDPLGYESDNELSTSIPDAMSGIAPLLVAGSCGISAESMDAHLQYAEDQLAASNTYMIFDDDFSLIWPETKPESSVLEYCHDTDSWCPRILSDSSSD